MANLMQSLESKQLISRCLGTDFRSDGGLLSIFFGEFFRTSQTGRRACAPLQSAVCWSQIFKGGASRTSILYHYTASSHKPKTLKYGPNRSPTKTLVG